MIALIFVLHVIVIGILLNRVRLKALPLSLTFLYFFGFYLIAGHYFKNNRSAFVPEMPLSDDYWLFRKDEKKSPFAESENGPRKKTDEETQSEDDKDMEASFRLQKNRRELEGGQAQPTTNP